MLKQGRLRVFMSYSLADDVGPILRRRLADDFEVVASEMLTGSAVRATALREALLEAFVAIVVLPPADDPSWRNVLFEAGVAAGAGVPLVLVGEPSSAPADVADDLIFRPEQVDEIIDIVVGVGRDRRSTSSDETVITDRDEGSASEYEQVTAISRAPAITPDYASQWTAQLEMVMDGANAIRLISDLFRKAGARVKAEPEVSAGSPTRPDLVVWHDDFLAAFGLPLTIEVLLEARSWPTVRQRLERILAASGGRTLVAVVVHGEMNSTVWTDGRRTILVFSAVDLANSLASRPVAEALSAMLASAVG